MSFAQGGVPYKPSFAALLFIFLSFQLTFLNGSFAQLPESFGQLYVGTSPQAVVSEKIFSELKLPITDKNYDDASIYLDKVRARPINKSLIVAFIPPKLDYSQYITLTGNQDGWGGCIGRSIIHSLDIIKEMEHPYSPDLSFWYLDAKQSQLIKSGVQDTDLSKTLLEQHGVCSEASFPSDYDKSKALKSQNGESYRDYSGMPQIAQAIDDEAGLYRISSFSDPQQATVDNIKSLMIQFGPVIASGAMPIVTGNKVDSITGTVNSEGGVRFTRSRPGELAQVYTGKLSNTNGILRMDGTFTHSGVAGTYQWNATFDQSYPNSAKFIQVSLASPAIAVDVTGRWLMVGNGIDFNLDLKQKGAQIRGTMVCTSCEGHCIAIVGYDDDVQAFKCLNSYGDTWNGNGSFIMPYDKVSENLDSVRYFVNLFSDRSTTSQAYTARLNISAPLRNKLVVKVGAEGKPPEIIWNMPNQVESPDNSANLSIDVPLPDYAASLWPPSEKKWYVEVTNNAQGKSLIKEITFVRLKNVTSCRSLGKFQIETYSAESLPAVPAGSTVKLYIKGAKSSMIQANQNRAYNLIMKQNGNSFDGSLSFISPLGTTLHEANREIRIYRKVEQQCVNLPPKYEPADSVMTSDDGSFTYHPAQIGAIYIAAVLNGNGDVQASSDEVTLQINVQPQKEPIISKAPAMTSPKTSPRPDTTSRTVESQMNLRNLLPAGGLNLNQA